MLSLLRRIFRLSPLPRHVAYRPAHPVTLREHGPDVPPGMFFTVPLEVPTTLASACRQGVDPRGWVGFVVQGSRS